MGNILDSIAILQNSIKELWEPVCVLMDKDVYNDLNKEAESCSLVQVTHGVAAEFQLKEVNGLEIKVSDSIGRNQVMFRGRDGNFSNYLLVKNIDKPEKPKRRGRYISCN